LSGLVRRLRISHMKGVFLRCFLVGLLLLVVPEVRAAPLKLDQLRVGPRTYTNVTVLGASATDLYFTHADGIANVKLKDVNADLQKRFDYDPKLAEQAEKRKIEEDSTFYETISTKLAAGMEEQARAARKAANTSPESVADPVSEQSLLGKKGPELKVEKWLGGKPALEGKFVLLVFWEPWSMPCRKGMTQWNGLQQVFTENLVVIGVTSESEADVEAMPEPKAKFPCAIDATANLRIAAGATSVPFALLLDPKGIVCFQGHPAALDEARLRLLLAKGLE
jgi:cytochrome c biogenesis protein CcmG, thiol:disulfide interchange protein DsbE